MMRMRTKAGSGSSSASNGEVDRREVPWELRPGGMLVQKRNQEGVEASVPAPTIKVRVKHGSTLHEVAISSQATFGELKKLLTAQTGLHHKDQKILFKDKERDSTAYLDLSGVKDRSKLVMVEDPLSQERRFVEMRKTAKMEKAAKAISEISLEVDRLAGQVSALESVISKGGRVGEKQLVDATELLMTELIKLDAIEVDGEVKLQRKMQVKRVQKYVETLDILKIHNTKPAPTGGQPPAAPPPQSRRASPAMVSKKWETFDSATAPAPALAPSSSGPNPKLNWEFFD